MFISVRLDSLRWTAWLDRALSPVLQVRVCFANWVPCFNSQSHPHFALSNNLAASRIVFLSSVPGGGKVWTSAPLPASAAMQATRGQQGSVRELGTYAEAQPAKGGEPGLKKEGMGLRL